MSIKNIFRKLSLIDLVNLGFQFVIIIFYIVAFNRTPYRTVLPFYYLGFIAFIFLFAYIRQTNKKFPLRQLIFLIYPIIFFFTLFETLYMLIPYFNTMRYDNIMTKIDFTILTVNPTVWIERIITPWLTDILYLCYFFYFPMPLILVGVMFKKKQYVEMQEAIIMFFICYYGAYISYFLIPVEGPRFYLAALHTVKLDGIILAEPVRRIVDFFESNKLDCFPSLHAAILAVTMYAANRYNKKIFYAYIPFAIGIMISLIYCRYHYFIDILAGLLWALISIYFGLFLHKKFSGKFFFHFAEPNK